MTEDNKPKITVIKTEEDGGLPKYLRSLAKKAKQEGYTGIALVLIKDDYSVEFDASCSDDSMLSALGLASINLPHYIHNAVWPDE